MRDLRGEGKKGKRAVDNEGCLIWEGPCNHNDSGKIASKAMWENPSDKDKCSTMYKVVLPQSEVIKFATATSNINLTCFLTCNGRCCHKVGVEKGRLSGIDRKRAHEEVE